MSNVCGYIRILGLEGGESHLVKPGETLRRDYRNPMPLPVWLDCDENR